MRAPCHIKVAANAPHRVSGDTIRKATGNKHYRFILNCPNTNTYEMHLTLLSWWSVSELLSALTDSLEMVKLSLKSKKPLSNSHSEATEGIHQGVMAFQKLNSSYTESSWKSITWFYQGFNRTLTTHKECLSIGILALAAFICAISVIIYEQNLKSKRQMKSSQSNWYEELLKHILSKCSHQVRNIGAIRRLIQRHSIAVMVLMATIKNVAMWNISMWNLEYLRANSFTQQIDLTDCTFCAIHPLKLKKYHMKFTESDSQGYNVLRYQHQGPFYGWVLKGL